MKLRVNPLAKTPFLQGIDTLEVPVRHGEGRLVIPDAATQAAIEAAGLNCLAYTDSDGGFCPPPMRTPSTPTAPP